MYNLSNKLSKVVAAIWVCNCILASTIAVREIWIPYMNAWWDMYTKISSDPFDGTVIPIAYIPDWTKIENQDKSKRFEDISISDYLPIPSYDPIALTNTDNSSKASNILHYTYITPYMGSYKLNYKEYDGSHLGVDIRSPIGTPVLSIANGVIIKTMEADATGNKYIVIRHDNVPIDGKIMTLYSGYLHLSEILVQEWMKIRKGDMIGRVGITGITTTPHLHIQIDTFDAPFHPYWPFTTTESRSAGLSFYDSINAGLWKEKAIQYTINPMNFINTFLWGSETNIGQMIQQNIPSGKDIEPTTQQQTIIASYVQNDSGSCSKKRYKDIPEKSTLGRMLYPLVDEKCLFQEYSNNFWTKTTVTQKEAITTLMKYYGITPANGTSHFLDLAIGDSFQWYAIVAYRRWILDGNYASPDKILTKWEFINLLVKIAQPPKNPSQIRIYNDVDAINPYYQSAQDYAYLIKARGGKLYPNNILTRGGMVQMIASLKEKK